MKKLFLLSLSILLVGAGCFGGGVEEPASAVTGDWHLVFDLPEGWVMVNAYDDGDAVDLESPITKETTDLYLQSTSKTILRGGALVGEVETLPEGEIESQDFLLIHTLRLSSRRVIPEGAEDLGDGFSRVKLCEEGEDCQLGGRQIYDYYYRGASNIYQFEIYARGAYDLAQAEEVILSLQEVAESAAE